MNDIQTIKHKIAGKESLKLNIIFGVSEEDIEKTGARVHKVTLKMPYKDHVGAAIYTFENILGIKNYTPKQLQYMTLFLILQRDSLIKEIAGEVVSAASPTLTSRT